MFVLYRGPNKFAANVMANSGIRQLSLPDHRVPNNVEQLAFKYMALCKVESSTDSDSEISPRWSDTSTMGCVSSTPESGTFRRTLPLTYDPASRHGCYSLFMDPYDGSSEDSDESNIDAVGISGRRTRQQGKGRGAGCRLSGRSRCILHHPASATLRDPVTEPQHLLDVQMKCGSDSQLCVRDIMPSHSDREGCVVPAVEITNDSTMPTQTMDTELHCQFDDSCLHPPRSSTSHTPGLVTPVLDCSSERPPCSGDLRSIYKRKLDYPGGEVVELGQRKRQCVVNMDAEQEEWNSEPCWSHLLMD